MRSLGLKAAFWFYSQDLLKLSTFWSLLSIYWLEEIKFVFFCPFWKCPKHTSIHSCTHARIYLFWSRHAYTHAQAHWAFYFCFLRLCPFLGAPKKADAYQWVKTVELGGHAAETEHVPEGWRSWPNAPHFQPECYGSSRNIEKPANNYCRQDLSEIHSPKI